MDVKPVYGLYDPKLKDNVFFQDADLEWLEDALSDLQRFNIKDIVKQQTCIYALTAEIRKRKEKETMSNPFINENNNGFVDAPNNLSPAEGEAIPFEGAPVLPASASGGLNESFSVDLSNVTGGYCIPEGTYTVRCMDVEQRIAKSGNPMFVWTFNVEGDKFAGFQLMHFTVITPAAMWKVGEVLQALGIGKPGEKINFTRNDVIGKTCTAEVIDDEYNGNTRSRIDKLSA